MGQIQTRQRRAITVEGIVQGVGFRLFIYALAQRHDLAGQVCNDAAGVQIEVEGPLEALDHFQRQIREEVRPWPWWNAWPGRPAHRSANRGSRSCRAGRAWNTAR